MNLEQFINDLPDRMEEIVNSAAGIVAEGARARCPVDSGRLRASIHVDGGTVIADCPYAAAVELGTGRTPPKPFMTPAMWDARGRLV